MAPEPRPGQQVVLHPTTDTTGHGSPLEGVVGRVVCVYEWGALLHVPKVLPNGTGRYRAGWHEMEVLEGVAELNGHTTVALARAEGYTGDLCDTCGSHRVLRNGPCLKCENCGSAGGCG